MLHLLALASAQAGTCQSVAVEAKATAYDAERTWLHEPGWFKPLDKPETAALSTEGYGDDEPLLAVRIGDETRAYPVKAMAYHHVANDIVAGEPLVVTY